jgi:hypothetical protein
VITTLKAQLNFDGLREDKLVHTRGIPRSMLTMLHALKMTKQDARACPEGFYPGALGRLPLTEEI